MVLPKRLEINIPPAVTSVAEAAVGHDIIMRAVASAVLQVHCVRSIVRGACAEHSDAATAQLADGLQHCASADQCGVCRQMQWSTPW